MLLVYFLVELSEVTFIGGLWGTWNILIGLISPLLFALVEFVLLFFVFGFLGNKSLFTKLLCIVMSIIGFIVSIDMLWSLTGALFYKGICEYLWSLYLSFMLFFAYSIPSWCLFYNKGNK